MLLGYIQNCHLNFNSTHYAGGGGRRKKLKNEKHSQTIKTDEFYE